MKNTLLILGLGAAGFLALQWWLERRNPERIAQDAQREANDQAGKAQESLQQAARPRIASDESLWRLPATTAGNNYLWSQIFGDGEVNNSAEKVRVAPEKNPMIFGFNP